MSCGRLWRLPDVRKARCHAAHSELYAMLVQPLSILPYVTIIGLVNALYRMRL